MWFLSPPWPAALLDNYHLHTVVLLKQQGEHVGKLLPQSDARVIRVQSIARNLIHGLNKGLMLKGEPRLISESSKFPSQTREYHSSAVSAHIREGTYRKKRRWKPATKHLDGKVWDIYVADKNINNAFCGLDGKIVIYSGLLKKLKSDEEIATVIAHEMGHAVARHVAEGILRGLVLLLLTFVVLDEFDVPFNLVHSLMLKLVDNCFSRRREAEADYIGLMSMASAGYDPQVAPSVYENRLGGGDSFEFLSTHPPGKKRAKLLKEPKTMKLAQQVYEDVSRKSDYKFHLKFHTLQ
ncbi:Peptidase M48 [Corchorus olitorius]|uniref:Peptidase M48 n=1 Tax=Corchorus olitorius TaxID=93759 RepID=A0A1R3HAG5_9ROSI|nr:Peptidase M48 [Corchorus olitorius]